jgi:hypothetical protein
MKGHTMKLIRITMAAAAVAAVLAASAASAGDQFSIKPPAGWVKISGSSETFLAMWGEPHPSQFRQNLNLVAEYFTGTLAQYVAGNKHNAKATTPDIEFGPEAEISTCDNHPAHFLPWKATMGGHKLIFEQVLSVWFGRGYVFTYTRAQGQPAIDAARDALSSLCVRQATQ